MEEKFKKIAKFRSCETVRKSQININQLLHHAPPTISLTSVFHQLKGRRARGKEERERKAGREGRETRREERKAGRRKKTENEGKKRGKEGKEGRKRIKDQENK